MYRKNVTYTCLKHLLSIMISFEINFYLKRGIQKEWIIGDSRFGNGMLWAFMLSCMMLLPMYLCCFIVNCRHFYGTNYLYLFNILSVFGFHWFDWSSTPSFPSRLPDPFIFQFNFVYFLSHLSVTVWQWISCELRKPSYANALVNISTFVLTVWQWISCELRKPSYADALVNISTFVLSIIVISGLLLLSFGFMWSGIVIPGILLICFGFYSLKR